MGKVELPSDAQCSIVSVYIKLDLILLFQIESQSSILLASASLNAGIVPHLAFDLLFVSAENQTRVLLDMLAVYH